MYRIRDVDPQDEEIADTLTELHQMTFFSSAPLPSFEQGNWWLAYHGDAPVAFAGMVQSTDTTDAAYLCRVGVISAHRGQSLQLRLLRAAYHRARRCGWRKIISDTTDNVASANNFIRAGYQLYRPESPWGWLSTLYWRKFISDRVR